MSKSEFKNGTVKACPSCDSPQINRRVTKKPDWKCAQCNIEFQNPVTRVSKNKKISKEDILEDLEKVYQKLGRTPSIKEYNKFGKYSYKTAYKRFGGWINLIREFRFGDDRGSDGGDST